MSRSEPLPAGSHRRERIGLFGGSFDPVHNGHLAAARAARAAAALDRVMFIPAATSPFKPEGTAVSGAHRLAMLRLAVADDPALTISDYELAREGISYTGDTVRHFSAILPEATLFFILGADALPTLHAWREVREWISLCAFVVLARPGWPLVDPPGFDAPTARRLLHAVVRDFSVDLSSTGIRDRVAAGASIRDRVPPAVAAYIANQGLYRVADP